MNKLSKIRETADITQEELAKILGVTKQAVNGWEKGSRKIPESRKSSLAAIFGVDESDFDEIPFDQENKTLIKENTIDNNSQKRPEDYIDAIYGKGTSNSLKEKKEQQKEIERKIHENFKGRNAITVKDQLTNADIACKLYGHFNNIVDNLLNKKDEKDSNYYRILELLLATESAMGIKKCDESNYDTNISNNNILTVEKCLKKYLIV